MSASPYMPEKDLMGNDILVFGYAGAYCDPVMGGYSLGNGYRVYLPELMRFATPDDWSPFGKGGVNPYLYAGDDPINHSDPSGHLSTLAWIGIIGGTLGMAASFAPIALAAIGAVGTDFAVGAAVATAGQEARTLTKVGIVFGGMADLSGLMSFALEDHNKTPSTVFGGISVALAAFSLGFNAAGSIRYLRRLVPAAGRAVEMETALRAEVNTLRRALDTTRTDLAATRAELGTTLGVLAETQAELEQTRLQVLQIPGPLPSYTAANANARRLSAPPRNITGGSQGIRPGNQRQISLPAEADAPPSYPNSAEGPAEVSENESTTL